MFREEVVSIVEEFLDVDFFLMETKVEVDFILEPVMEVVGENKANLPQPSTSNGFFVVSVSVSHHLFQIIRDLAAYTNSELL